MLPRLGLSCGPTSPPPACCSQPAEGRLKLENHSPRINWHLCDCFISKSRTENSWEGETKVAREMESGQRLRVVLAVASLAALTLFFALQHRRRRKQERRSGSCYLWTDSKPQHTFKRVLTDNSYAPFKHLKVKDSDSGELLKNSSTSLEPESLVHFAEKFRVAIICLSFWDCDERTTIRRCIRFLRNAEKNSDIAVVLTDQ